MIRSSASTLTATGRRKPPFRLQICPPPGFDDIRIGVDVGLGPWRRLLGVTDQRRNILAVGGVDLDSVVPPSRLRIHLHLSPQLHRMAL